MILFFDMLLEKHKQKLLKASTQMATLLLQAIRKSNCQTYSFCSVTFFDKRAAESLYYDVKYKMKDLKVSKVEVLKA